MTISITDRRWLGLAATGVLLASAGVAPVWAQDPASTEPAAAESVDKTVTLDTTGVISSDAQAVLDRMTATLQSLQRYSLSAQITRDEMLPFGYKLQNNESAKMWVERPNRLRMEVDGDIKHRTYIYDGKKLSMLVPDLNIYSEAAAPDTIGELIRKLLDIGVEMPLTDMLYQSTTGSLTEDVRVGIVVGDSEVDGVATDHLAFRQPLVDWQLWVEKGANALPRKLLITTRYEVGDPQYQAIMRWDLKPRIDAKAFTFVPPSGATLVPNHTELVAQGGDK